MRGAGRLILAALNELAEEPPRWEYQRRELELVTRATWSVLREFVALLEQHREPMPAGACPHCQHVLNPERERLWAEALGQKPRRLSERCVRCGGCLGVTRESAARDPVRFPRSLPRTDRTR